MKLGFTMARVATLAMFSLAGLVGLQQGRGSLDVQNFMADNACSIFNCETLFFIEDLFASPHDDTDDDHDPMDMDDEHEDMDDDHDGMDMDDGHEDMEDDHDGMDMDDDHEDSDDVHDDGDAIDSNGDHDTDTEGDEGHMDNEEAEDHPDSERRSDPAQ